MAMVNAQCGQTVRIGFETENKRTQVRFDLSDIMAEFPGGTAVLTIRRPGDEEATVSTSVTMDGTALVWNVTAWECERRGFLYAQVIYAVGDVVAKTKIYRFQVNESLMGEADEPEGWEDWVDELVEAAADTRAAVESYDEMTASATGLPAGSAPTAVIDRTGENPVLELGIPAGNDGYTPQRGTDYWTEEDQAAMRQDIADDLTAARQAINDEKVLAVGAVETAGTTQVGLVTAEGTAQKAAVVAQGQATIASIPADYTNLSNDVNDLKSEIDELEDDVNGEKNYIENVKLITTVGDSRGDTTQDSNFSTTEFIPLSDIGESGQVVKAVYGTIGENSMFAVYDSSKNFIDAWSLQSSATERSFTFSYTSYTNPAYVRFSFKKGYSARIAIMYGSTETRTAWAAEQNGGISDDVDNLKNAVNALPESYMATGKYMDYSMENRLNPAECDLNAIVTPSTGAVGSYNGYFTTDYIPIRTSETLYFYRIDKKEIKPVRMFAAYDANKNVISDHGSTSEVTSITQSGNMAYIKASMAYVASDYARTPEDTAALANVNPVYIPGYGNFPVIKTQYLERHTMWVRSTDTETQIIQKLVDAFNTGNVDVYFERATYQFGTELAKVNTVYGMIHNEIPIGNGCRYYFNGSTLIATIDLTQHPAVGNDDEFYCNFFGCQRRPSSYELHDGVLIATDTRYVVHDESSALSGSYKHLYQNMEMHYHTNQRQETIRKCIGGGTGASGVVEIIGCKFTTDSVDVCVSYHGNGTDVNGAEFDINVRDSWFSNGMRAGELSASQTARLFYTGNSAMSEPSVYDRWTVTKFLNEIRT